MICSYSSSFLEFSSYFDDLNGKELNNLFASTNVVKKMQPCVASIQYGMELHTFKNLNNCLNTKHLLLLRDIWWSTF